MPQFTLRDLFVTTTLVALGVQGLLWSSRMPHTLGETTGICCSFGLIAVGLGLPFYRDWR